jgi:hypothetical protein
MTAAARELLPDFRVFLSHAPGDRPAAERVIRLLAAGGRVHTFSDSMVSSGAKWVERLRLELEACDVFMVIGSPRAAISDRVLHELGGAWALDKPMIVVTPQVGWTWQLPVPARSVQHVSLEDIEQPGCIERLLADLTLPANPPSV